MEFGFTAEQAAFRAEVRDFCRKHVTPELLERVRGRGDENDASLYAAIAQRRARCRRRAFLKRNSV